MGRRLFPTTDIFTEGRRNQAIANDVKDLKNQQSALSSIRVGLPEPHEPFTVVYRPGKNGVVAVLPIDLPADSYELEIVCIATSNRDTDSHFENRRIHSVKYAVDDSQRTAGYGEFPFPNEKGAGGLEYNKQYDLLRLKDADGGGNRLVNPPDDPARTDSPLETFTTPAAYGSPSAPHVGNIIENKMDDTTKAFDAFVTVQVIAPYLSSAVITGTVSITSGSNVVTGTGTSFVSQVGVTGGLTINGETHIVASVINNTSLTVDNAFKQTLSGQSATTGALQTWGDIKSDPAQDVGLPATRVVAKFRLTDDSNSRALAQSYYFSEAEAAQTSIIFRVPGFIAARKYDWVANVIVDNGERITINPLTTQTFVAGNFTVDTPGIPEITSPTWKYDNQPPYSDQIRNTHLFLTQPNPPVALERRETHRRLTGSGTIAYTSGNATITGTGTAFTTEAVVGNQIVVGTYLATGYQRLTITAIASDTSLTVDSTTLPTATASGIAYKVGKIVDESFVRHRKFYPDGGGQIKFNLGEIKTKKLATQDFVNVLYSQYGNRREDVDNFTTGSSGEIPNDTAAPSGLNSPVLNPQKGSFVFKKMYATVNDNTEQYKEVVFWVANSGGGLINFIDPVNRAVTSSESTAKVNIGTSGHYTLNMRADEIRALFPTGATLYGYYYVTNSIGPSGKSIDIGVAFSAFKQDPSEQDTAAANAATSLTLAWGQKKGYKSNWVAPITCTDSSTLKSLQGYKVAYSDNAAANWMNPATGAVASPNTEAGATVFVGPDTHHTTHLRYADLASAFQAGVKVKITPVNIVQSAATNGTSATSSFLAPTQDDPAADDTAAPGGTLTAPAIKKLKTTGLRIVLTAPTTGNLKIRKSNVYIANGNHSTATTWVSAADLTSSTGTESVGAIECQPTGGHTINVTRATLESIFGAGATISVYATWTNDIGTSGFSGAGTYSLSNAEGGAVGQDTAVPSSLATPTLTFVSREGLVIDGLTVGANWNVPVSKDLELFNGSTFFDIATYLSTDGATAQSTSSPARYAFGPGKNEVKIGIRLKDLVNVLGSSATIRWRATNSFGAQTTPVSSNTITLANKKDVFGSRDAIAVVDVGATMVSPANIIANGDFRIYDTVAGSLGSWGQTDLSSATLNNIATSGGVARIIVDNAQHALNLRSGASNLPAQNIKQRLLPGEYCALTFMVKATASGNYAIKLHAYNSARLPTLVDNLTDPINATVALTSTYQIFGAVIQMSATADIATTLGAGDYASHYFVIEFPRTGGGTTYATSFFIDKIMLVRGQQPLAYAPRPDEQDSFTALPPNAITFPDIGQISGTQGGWRLANGGGLCVPF